MAFTPVYVTGRPVSAELASPFALAVLAESVTDGQASDEILARTRGCY
jgi:hypothetical protein